MRRFFLTLLTAFSLICGCASLTPAPNSGSNLRPPGVSDIEFVHLADVEVKKLFPEWYVGGVTKYISIIPNGLLFATMSQRKNGTFMMLLYPSALALNTLGDLTTVLFHEYVHAKIWNRLKETIQDPACNSAVHELTAYGEEMAQFKIRTTWKMNSTTRLMYRLAYRKAQLNCSLETYIDFPEPGIY